MKTKQQNKETTSNEQSSSTRRLVKADGVFNPIRAKEIWGREVTKAAELFQLTTKVGNDEILSDPHFVGLEENRLKFLPYDNSWGLQQYALLKNILPGEIAISIKHHSPLPDSAMTEHIKLQCTHIQIAVGVPGGVLTINNPQGYESGLFGDESYPMIFIKPKLSLEVSPQLASEYLANIRTWLVLVNTFSHFPGDYNGGDPLTCISREDIIRFGNAIVDALLGEEAAIAWLAEESQGIYCAELAYVALNLGLYFPLNKEALGTRFEAVKKALTDKVFLERNSNPHVNLIDISTASAVLKPLDQEITSPDDKQIFWPGLAIRPFTLADLVEEYLKRTLPRASMGEAAGAKVQGDVFSSIRPDLLEMAQIPSSILEEVNQMLDRIQETISTEHSSYTEFRARIAPTLLEISKKTLEAGIAYVPPHCFLVRAADHISGQDQSGVLGWEYIGHGLHKSLFKEI